MNFAPRLKEVTATIETVVYGGIKEPDFSVANDLSIVCLQVLAVGAKQSLCCAVYIVAFDATHCDRYMETVAIYLTIKSAMDALSGIVDPSMPQEQLEIAMKMQNDTPVSISKNRSNWRRISCEQLENFGVGEVAYVKPVMTKGGPEFSIHAADGGQLAIATTETLAVAAIIQNDMLPHLVH